MGDSCAHARGGDVAVDYEIGSWSSVVGRSYGFLSFVSGVVTGCVWDDRMGARGGGRAVDDRWLGGARSG